MSHKKHYHRERTNASIERRKHPRLHAHIPVDINLINLKKGKSARAKFKGITTDISMGGLCLEMNYPASDILSFTPKLMGEKKEFNLDLYANVGTGDVNGVGEVRWARIHPLSALKILKMGIFLKGMRRDEREKWTNFVMRQSKGISQHVSFQQPHRRRISITLLCKCIRGLISSNLSIDYILPMIILVSSFVIIYWCVEMRYYHLIISCGIAITMVFLMRSRSIFRKYLKPKYEIPHSLLRKWFQCLQCNRSAGPLK